MIKKFVTRLSLLLAFVSPVNFVFAQTKTSARADSQLDGFTAEQSVIERQLEERFAAIPNKESAREHLRRLTAEPHVAGTPEDYQTALYVRDQFRRAGLSAEIKEYQVMLAEPKRPTVLEMIRGSKRERLPLQEAVLAQDPSSANPKIIPLFNGYSASGDVTAPLLYVNYGLPDDYEALKKIGVSARDRIVIARYGRSFRGVKAKVAEENGASGLIIYSDPADDGYMQGDVYPEGPWRPESSAQRGSVEYIFQYPGDPLTPNEASTPGTKRLTKAEVTNLPRIPVQPISYGDARRLLVNLRGAVRPKNFQGGLPFAYHVGGNESVRVHLQTEMDFPVKTIWNVVARIDGQDAERDRWVILGNHRDAWTFGAVDPNSGSAALLEVARGFGELLKSGWRPRRSIILCSWDGEEYGLIGSTEWAEEHAAELKEKAVAYLNMDAAVSGADFSASAVPSLWRLIREAARDVQDPKSGKSVYEAWQEKAKETGETGGAESTSKEAAIGALGSGSDFTPFIQHLGVPSVDMSFSGDYGVYHSAYDSFHWMEKNGDPSFAYHVASAQIWGLIALRLTNAPALPFHYEDYAQEIARLLAETQKYASAHNLSGAMNITALSENIKGFGREAERLEQERGQVMKATGGAQARLKAVNETLLKLERALTDERGLEGRPWYKHQIYAPGFYTGYAAQPLPDLRQGVEDRNTAKIERAIVHLDETIKRAREVSKGARN